MIWWLGSHRFSKRFDPKAFQYRLTCPLRVMRIPYISISKCFERFWSLSPYGVNLGVISVWTYHTELRYIIRSYISVWRSFTDLNLDYFSMKLCTYEVTNPYELTSTWGLTKSVWWTNPYGISVWKLHIRTSSPYESTYTEMIAVLNFLSLLVDLSMFRLVFDYQ